MKHLYKLIILLLFVLIMIAIYLIYKGGNQNDINGLMISMNGLIVFVILLLREK